MAVSNNSTTTQYIQPQYSTQTNAAVAGGIQGMLGNNGYLNSTMGNWYDQAPAQGALGQYAQYDSNGASNFAGPSTTYNPNKLADFTNPYVDDVVQANNIQSNQNLTDNILPAVNSTFAGNGQFGSTRNAEFTNRAIRDNQQTLNNTNANVMMNATNQANQNYWNWTQMGVDANNKKNTAYQNWTQMGLNAGQQDYANWYQKANFPIGALGTMANAASALESSQPLATSVNQTIGAAKYDPTSLEKTVSALGALNTGVNDGTVDWLTSLLD